MGYRGMINKLYRDSHIGDQGLITSTVITMAKKKPSFPVALAGLVADRGWDTTVADFEQILEPTDKVGKLRAAVLDAELSPDMQVFIMALIKKAKRNMRVKDRAPVSKEEFMKISIQMSVGLADKVVSSVVAFFGDPSKLGVLKMKLLKAGTTTKLAGRFQAIIGEELDLMLD